MSRCLNLAKQLRCYGADCSFLLNKKNNEYTKKIKNEGFKLNNWKPISFKDKKQNSKNLKPDWLIIDERNNHKIWQKQLKKYAKHIMIINDSVKEKINCDIYVNQNYGIKKNKIKNLLISKKTQICLGPKFAMVGSDYLKYKKNKNFKNSIKNILIFLSYGNHTQALVKIVSLIKNNTKKKIHLCIISNTKAKKILVSTKLVKIKVYRFTTNMAALLSKSDLAIGALGMATWERFCLGVPSFVFALSAEQKKLLTSLTKNNFCKYLGSKKKFYKTTLIKILNHQIQDQLHAMAQKAKKLVDGLGCQRLALKIMLFRKRIIVRNATLKDEKKLFRLVNDPLVRENSFNQKSITSEEHHKWFRKKIKDKTHCLLFCAESDAGTFLGQVRLELVNNKWKIDYSIIPEARGNGIAKKMLEEAIHQTCKKNQIRSFVAVVKNKNKPSLKIFKSLKFKKFTFLNKTLFYKKIKYIKIEKT